MYELNLFFTVVLFVVFLSVYSVGGKASIFHPLTYYLFFHGLVFVIRPIFQYFYGFDFVYRLYNFFPTDEVRNWSLIVANLGFVSFFVVSTILVRAPARFVPGPSERDNRAGTQLLIAFLICSPLIAVSMYYQLSGSLGDENLIKMVMDAKTKIAINTEGNGYINDANQMLGPFAVLIAWAFRFRPLALIPFLIFVAFRIYLGWGRWTFILTSASLALLFLYDRRLKWFEPRAILGGLALLLVFNALSENRELARELLFSERATQVRKVEKHFFDAQDFANLEYLQYVVWVVPDLTGTYDYFIHNLQVLTEPIPRVLWSGKPVGPPIRMFNYFDYGNPVGFTVSLPGQGWANLGVFGVVIWCAFGGALWARLYNWFMEGPQGRFQVAIYCVMLPIAVQWFRDGTLLSLIKFPLFLMLPVLIWWTICKMTASRGVAFTRGRKRGVRQWPADDVRPERSSPQSR